MAFEQTWFVAALSSQLGSRPLARTVLGHPLVLFRDGAGQAQALEDRCPHRNVALSLGRVVDGTLACAYHGWRFDGLGRCVEAPCSAPGEPLPARTAPTYPCLEQDQLLWVSIGGRPAEDPPRLPAGPGLATFQLANRFSCPAVWVICNVVDCGHTGFLHGGLFRGKPQKVIRARLQETPHGVRIENVGEGNSSSLLSRLFLPKGGAVEHVDEFFAPNRVVVRYRLGAREITSTTLFTPESDEATLLFSHVAIRFPPFSHLMAPVLCRVSRKILEQDRGILENQAAQLRQFGRPLFESVYADAPTLWVTRAYEAYAENGPRAPGTELRHKDVDYKL